MGVAVETLVADVAERLRTAREQAGLTIEAISARTKIKPALLQAIERGEFERLPGTFFARAFLRTYARELHLPADELVAEYDAQHAPRSAAADTQAAPTVPDVKPGGGPRPQASDEPQRRGGQGWPRPAWPVITVLAAILLLILAMNWPRTRPAPETGAVGTGGTATPPAPAVSAPADPVPTKLSIEIRPTRRIWVTGSADGKRAIFGLVEAGERVTIEAQDVLSFRVGDAAAFEYSLNGSPGKPPGRPGEVREFTITRDNYRTFIR